MCMKALLAPVELAWYVCAMHEGSAATGNNFSNMCSWLRLVGKHDWFQVPGIPALGEFCPWQCAGVW